MKEGQYWMSVNNGTLQCAFNTAPAAGTYSGDGYVPLNAWSHIACTYDGLAIRSYVNEYLTAVVPFPNGRLSVTSAPLFIGGRSPTTGAFNGRVDEVKVSAEAKRFQAPGDMGQWFTNANLVGEVAPPGDGLWHAVPGFGDMNIVKRANGTTLKLEYDDTIRSDYSCANFGEQLQVQVIADGVALPSGCAAGDYLNDYGRTADYHMPFHMTCWIDGLAAGPHKLNLQYNHSGSCNTWWGYLRSHRSLDAQELIKGQF